MKSLGHLLIESITLQPGQEWTDSAAAWHFVHVSGGAAYWLGGAAPRSLSEGEMLIIPPGARGTVRASQIGAVRLHGFNFAPDLLCGFFTLAEGHYFESGDAEVLKSIQCLPSTHPATQQFAALARCGPKPNSLAQRIEVLSVVAAVFDEEMGRHRAPAPLGTGALHRFEQLITQMPDTEIINHSPEQLARLCGCSPRHFNRLFRKHFGASARARQTELRLLKARRLLCDTNAKVIHVAYDSGYRHLGLFNSMFKKRFGTTPSEWRKTAQKTLTGIPRRLAKRAGAIALIAGLWFGSIAAAQTNSATNPPAPGLNPVAPSSPDKTARASDAVRQRMIELDLGEASRLSAVRAAANPATGPLSEPGLHLGTPVSAEEMAQAQNAVRRRLIELSVPEWRREALAAAASTNGNSFEVKGYELIGNTVLPPVIGEITLQPYVGPAVTFDAIRQGMADLQLAYHSRGYVTVSVGLPPQKLTNGVVKVQVTEGRIAEIEVLNNRYFSSNNIMRALPSLHTNMLLNSQVLQRELDAANASRDRQIYPSLSPGPEPGTSLLDLKVKDRLPLHARVEMDNFSTPATPDLRANFSAQYNNLWDLNHQVGIQYSFTPDGMKLDPQGAGFVNKMKGTNQISVPVQTSHISTPFDEPLIANYSAYYRLPLWNPEPVQRRMDAAPARFGYNEATHQFQAPPATGRPELTFYASRSTTDTGIQSSPKTQVTTNNPTLNIEQNAAGENATLNEQVGARFSLPLRSDDNDIHSTLSFGMDFKRYRLASYNTNIFYETVTFTNGSGQRISTNYIVASGQPGHFTGVDYLPINVGLNLSIADRLGTTFLNASLNCNLVTALSDDAAFARKAYSTNAPARYATLDLGLSRDQKFYEDWSVLFNANSQVTADALISGEQFPLGGMSSVRGYHEGEIYGDSGWRASVEPRTPWLNVGTFVSRLNARAEGGDSSAGAAGSGTPAPLWLRGSAFMDYGEAYLNDAPRGFPGRSRLWGVGINGSAHMGNWLDAQLTIAWPLLNSPATQTGDMRVFFAVGVQF